MELVSRQEAIARGLSFYYTGKACSKGHVAPRYLKNRTCESCKFEFDKKHRNANPDRFTKWYAKNKQHKQESNRQWVFENRGKKNSLLAKRHASKKKATPKWLSKVLISEIADFYVRANKLTEFTGIAHEVDHIVPLTSDTVCGLHVPWNLQILFASENQSKKNYSWPDKWEIGNV
jgi:hypothetical protein